MATFHLTGEAEELLHWFVLQSQTLTHHHCIFINVCIGTFLFSPRSPQRGDRSFLVPHSSSSVYLIEIRDFISDSSTNSSSSDPSAGQPDSPPASQQTRAHLSFRCVLEPIRLFTASHFTENQQLTPFHYSSLFCCIYFNYFCHGSGSSSTLCFLLIFLYFGLSL